MTDRRKAYAMRLQKNISATCTFLAFFLLFANLSSAQTTATFSPAIITVGGTGPGSTARGLAADGAGNLYVADFARHVVERIDSAGNVTVLVGTAGSPASGASSGDGGLTVNALLNHPSDVKLDAAGNF